MNRYKNTLITNIINPIIGGLKLAIKLIPFQKSNKKFYKHY